MGIEWGNEPTIWENLMDPKIAALLVTNRADIEAIISKIGIGTLLELAPHFINIINTLKGTGK